MRTNAWLWSILVIGCKSYQAKPLEPAEVLDLIAEERRVVAAEPALSLADAAAWLQQYDPAEDFRPADGDHPADVEITELAELLRYL